MFKKYLPLLIIIIFSWWSVSSIFHPGFFPMHDDEQIARLFELHETLMDGQFPPRWVPDLGFGFGYPLYNFYPPLVYYLGEIAHLLGLSLIASMKTVMILGMVFSGIFIYLLGKEFFGKIGGIVAAAFYIYSPYHAVDLYVRGALAEFYSFVFLPACLWSTVKLIKEKRLIWLVLNSIFLSLLVLSHNLIVIAFVPFYLIWLLFFLIQEKEKRKAIFLCLGSILLAFGLTAYFSLPALLEKKYTLVDNILLKELASYNLHFVYLRQFWNSPWGYGGSIYGLLDGMSFEVGKMHIILSLLSMGLGLYLIYKRKKEGLILTFLFTVFAFSLFMASFKSAILWQLFQPLWYLQFPWRFLIFASLFSSLLAGAFCSQIFILFKKDSFMNKPFIFSIVILTLVIAINKDYFRPARYLAVGDKDYTNREELQWRVSKISFEYVPKGISTVMSDIETTQVAITKEELPKTSFQASENINVTQEQNSSDYKRYRTNGRGGQLVINTYNFPGWEAFIDGKKVAIDDNNKFRLIKVTIPGGPHELAVKFRNTPVRSLGNIITVLSALLVVLLLWRKKLNY